MKRGNEFEPKEGESIYVPAYEVLIVDKSTPILNAVIVEGVLIFSDEVGALSFDAYYFIVRFGKLVIGTEKRPF